ncbi:MAG: hypothetical protein J0I48_00135, partial [Devosia sp.]|nr:hypothetical protein [Devosia sp.]
VTVSVGIADLDPGDPSITARRLIARADEALYDAKAAGRDRVLRWAPGTETAGGRPPAVAEDDVAEGV